MTQDQQLRDHLVKLMRGGQAFRPMDDVLQELTLQEAGKQVKSLPYTVWQLLEHLRFAQRDILDFCRDAGYQEPTWPDDYWPAEAGPANQQELDQSLNTMARDLEEMIRLVQDPGNDLFAPLPNGTGQTLLREAMLVAEHNAYHLGQLVVLRRLLGNWKDNS